MIMASARISGISLSLKVRDLLKKAIEFEEDEDLLQTAKQRDAAWDDKKALTHIEFWGNQPRKRNKKCSH